MPSDKRGESSATPTTYRSTSAAPRQQRFPGRRTSVRTYGKSTPRTLKQETLTQMDFVGTPAGSAYDLIELDDSQDDGEGHHLEIELEAPPATKRESNKPSRQDDKKKARSNRRKSAGESLDPPPDRKRDSKRRKTLGDTPTASVSSSFHTQTLTQFLSNKDPEEQEADGLDWHISDSEAGGDGVLVLETPKKDREVKAEAGSELATAKPDETAVKKVSTPSGRTMKTEIPSSQSPLTPMLLRYSPAGPRESPLKRKSSPLRPQTTPLLGNVRRTPRLVVEDTFATLSSSPATPTARSAAATPKASTGKRLRFEFEVDKENITPGRKKPKSPKPPRDTSGRKPLQEVPDSDEELDDATDEAESVTEDVSGRVQRDETPCPVLDEEEEEEEEEDDDATVGPESCYGDLGAETQARLLTSEATSSRELDEEQQQENHDVPAEPEPHSAGKVHFRRSQTPKSSQSSSRQTRAQTISTPTRPPGTSPLGKETQFTPYTQGLESQRLPLEDIRALGPQTNRSDIMVTLHPEALQQILSGAKDHEFRPWKIPPEVSRVWIYATQPDSELRYMCILGPPKVPGEIVNEKGLGNAKFNQGTKKFADYAYEILQIFELNNPVSLTEMTRKGWIKGPPPKYTFVPPAVVGELTANLRCALFGGDEEDEDEAPEFAQSSSPQLTESQELKAQLQSDGDYSTQSFPSAKAPIGTAENLHDSPDPAEDQENVFAKPALPKDSQIRSDDMRTPRPSRNAALFSGGGGSSSLVRTSQATTISQLSSSPAMSPEKSQLAAAAATPSQQRRSRRSGGTSSTKNSAQRRARNSVSAAAITSASTTTTTITTTASTSASHIVEIVDGSSSPALPRYHGTEEDSQQGARDAAAAAAAASASSSQLMMQHSRLTASTSNEDALMPESLLLLVEDDDENDGPPPIVWDSADEHSD